MHIESYKKKVTSSFQVQYRLFARTVFCWKCSNSGSTSCLQQERKRALSSRPLLSTSSASGINWLHVSLNISTCCNKNEGMLCDHNTNYSLTCLWNTPATLVTFFASFYCTLMQGYHAWDSCVTIPKASAFHICHAQCFMRLMPK